MFTSRIYTYLHLFIYFYFIYMYIYLYAVCDSHLVVLFITVMFPMLCILRTFLGTHLSLDTAVINFS